MVLGHFGQECRIVMLMRKLRKINHGIKMISVFFFDGICLFFFVIVLIVI